MTPDQQFWWNWYVLLAGAAANFLVALVALFGERLWKRAFPPKLKIKLLEKYGEKTVAVGERNGQEIRNDVRFFHLQVWNERRRLSPARNAQVFLTHIEEQGPDGRYQVAWTGNVAMRWRDQEIVPVTQTIGAHKDADFFMIGEQTRLLSLMPLIAQFQVRSNEADSETFRVKVAWDGRWEDGDLEMHHHLRVKEA